MNSEAIGKWQSFDLNLELKELQADSVAQSFLNRNSVTKRNTVQQQYASQLDDDPETGN